MLSRRPIDMGGTGDNMLRRVGVIGDVHTEDKRLACALRALRDHELDATLCVGDITDGPNPEASVDQCCSLLRLAGVITVGGNHDRWAIESDRRDLDGATIRDDLAADTIAFLETLPADIALTTVAGSAVLCHGLLGDDMACVKPHDHGPALRDNVALANMLRDRRYGIVINGHTHLPMVRTIEGLTIINAGTLHRDHAPGFIVIDFADRHVDFYSLDDDLNVSPPMRLGFDGSSRQA